MMQLGAKFIVVFGVLAIGFLAGCKKDDPQPLQAEVKAKILAGDAGSSKSWRLVTLTQRIGTGPEQNGTLDACESDNIYKFSNNAAQDYEESEGAAKCDAADAAIADKGTWAFTLDGTRLVLNTTVVTTSQTAFSFNRYFPYPGEVVELSESILKIKMTYTFDGASYVDTFTFNKN